MLAAFCYSQLSPSVAMSISQSWEPVTLLLVYWLTFLWLLLICSHHSFSLIKATLTHTLGVFNANVTCGWDQAKKSSRYSSVDTVIQCNHCNCKWSYCEMDKKFRSHNNLVTECLIVSSYRATQRHPCSADSLIPPTSAHKLCIYADGPAC